MNSLLERLVSIRCRTYTLSDAESEAITILPRINPTAESINGSDDNDWGFLYREIHRAVAMVIRIDPSSSGSVYVRNDGYAEGRSGTAGDNTLSGYPIAKGAGYKEVTATNPLTIVGRHNIMRARAYSPSGDVVTAVELFTDPLM